MTSKEALENLVHCKSETRCKECKHKHMCTMERDYNTIKQDLEVLEWLKEDNKEQVELVGKLLNKNNQLEKENKELKDKLSKLENPILYMCRSRASKDFEKMRLIGLATMLNVPIILEDTETLKEKQKLEKVIEILKNNLCIEFDDSYNGVKFKEDKYDECDYTILCLDDELQYYLLKEMLKNDK